MLTGLLWCYGCGQEDGADLYFVFEGHFHCLQKGAVVGTISPGMLFGILEVFGISDLSQDMRIRLVGWDGWMAELLGQFAQKASKTYVLATMA